MKKLILISMISLFILNCGEDKSKNGTIEDRQTMPVKSMIVETVDFSKTLSYKGSIEAERTARLFPEIPGKIQKLNVKIGDVVKKNQILGELDKSMLQLQYKQASAGFEVAKASLKDMEKNWKRLQTLHEENGISDQQYEKAKLGYEGAQAQFNQASAGKELLGLQIEKSVIKAPYNGIITQEGFEIGDLYSPQAARKPVYTVMDLSKVKLKLQVPQSEISHIASGQLSKINTTYTEPVQGYVSIVNVAADPGSKTFLVEVEFDNSKLELKVGTFGTVEIEVEQFKNVFVVPKTAVLDDGSLFIVEDNVAKKRVVELGVENDGDIIVLSGITEGQSIVTEGAFLLIDGSPVKDSE